MKKYLCILAVTLMAAVVCIGLSACSSDDDDVAVTGVRLNKQSLILLKGTSEKLVAIVTPVNASDTTVTWSSSAPQIVSVDDSGMVRAIKAGSSTITVTTTDGKYTASCEVTVNVDVTSIMLSETQISIEKGNTKSLVATVLPNDATNKNITWHSENPNVATIDSLGVITALTGGETTIWANAGKCTASCKVIVTVSVQSVELDKNSLELVRGQVSLLKEVILPADATNKNVIWHTSDSSIATVNKGEITALKAGHVVISVTTEDGSKTANCNVTVKQSENIDYSPYGNAQEW